MEERIPTSVLSIISATQEEGEKLTTLTCRMTGEFKPFTDVSIFPAEKKFQIRDIIHLEKDTYKIKVKGIAFKDCKPFSIITPLNLKVKYSVKGCFVSKEFRDKDLIAGNYYITGGVFDGYRMFNKDKFSAKVRKTGVTYSVEFPFKAPLVPGATYIFENNKGEESEMTLLYPGDLSKKSIGIINSRLEKFRSRPSIKGVYSIILRTDLYVDLPFYLENEDFEGSIKIGSKRIMEREYNSVRNKILKQSKASGGVLLQSVKKSCDVKPAFFYTVLEELFNENLLFQDSDYLVFNSEDRENYLSPLTKICYKQIVESKDSGYSRREVKDRGMINCFYELERMRIVRVLDDDLYYSLDSYKVLLDKVFDSKKIGEFLTISEIRDKTGLSRRFVISLLNKLEHDGFIERSEDDERVVVKIP